MNKKSLIAFIFLTPFLMANSPAPNTKISYENTITLTKDQFNIEEDFISFNLENNTKYFITTLDLNHINILEIYDFGYIIPPYQNSQITIDNTEVEIKDKNQLDIYGKNFSISTSKVSDLKINSATYNKLTKITSLDITYNLNYLDSVDLHAVYFYYKVEERNLYYASKNYLPSNLKQGINTIHTIVHFENDLTSLTSNNLLYFIGTNDYKPKNNLFLIIIIVASIFIFILIIGLFIFILYRLVFIKTI